MVGCAKLRFCLQGVRNEEYAMKRTAMILGLMVCAGMSPMAFATATDPITVRRVVTNKTGEEFNCKMTWGYDVKDQVTTIPADGKPIEVVSNTHSDGTVLECHPNAPFKADGLITARSSTLDGGRCALDQGTIQINYDYWDGQAHITSGLTNNSSNPTSANHYDGQTWIMKIEGRNLETDENAMDGELIVSREATADCGKSEKDV